jgi:hypothetical protein
VKSAPLSMSTTTKSLATPAESRPVHAPTRVEAVEGSQPDSHYSVQEQLAAIEASALAPFAGHEQVRQEACSLAAAIKQHAEEIEPRSDLDSASLPAVSGHLDIEA